MKLTLNLQDCNANFDNIEIDYNIINSNAYFEIPEISDDTLVSVLLKNQEGMYCEYSSSFGRFIQINYLPAGENYIILRAQKHSDIIWTSGEICININSIEPVYNIDKDKTILKWNSVNNADGYMIYTKSNDGVFTSIKEVKVNEANLYAIPIDTELKIKPYILENSKRNYIAPIAKLSLSDIKKTENRELKAIFQVKKAAVEILWNHINNADSYIISFRCGNIEEEYQAGSNNIYTLKNLPTGLTHFCIKALKDSKCIASSPIYACEIKDIELTAINKDYKVFLYWNQVQNIDGYRIFKKNENDEFVGFMSTQEECAEISNLVPGEICEFKVKPYIMENGQRTYIGLAAKCKVNTFTRSSIELTLNKAYDNKIALSWIFDGDVDGFEIFKDGKEYLTIEDGLAHIELVEFSNSNYQIKGYKTLGTNRIYTCSSEQVNIDNCTSSRLHQTKPETYKLSIVIPAYNAQEFISRCISTVLGSNIEDIEVIIVDDGSKDNTEAILNWYAETYPDFVKVFFKENGGAADARNYGIKHAKGEYIAFIDSDDMIRPTAYKKMASSLDSTKSDIAITKLYKIDNERYWVRHILPLPVNTAIQPEDYMRLIFTEKFNNVAVWNKMYKTSLVQEHLIPLISYEDASWTPYILSWADKLCYVDEIGCEWDRKIRKFTLSNELSNRDMELKFKERHQAVKFFYEQGNPAKKEVLAYLFAKRMYNQGETANYPPYFEVIYNMKDELINNKYLLEDNEYSKKIFPILRRDK